MNKRNYFSFLLSVTLICTLFSGRVLATDEYTMENSENQETQVIDKDDNTENVNGGGTLQ